MKVDPLQSAAMIVWRGNFIVGEWAQPTGSAVVPSVSHTIGPTLRDVRAPHPERASRLVTHSAPRPWITPAGGDHE